MVVEADWWAAARGWIRRSRGGEYSSPPPFEEGVVEGRAMGWGAEVDSRDHGISAGARPPAPARRPTGHSRHFVRLDARSSSARAARRSTERRRAGRGVSTVGPESPAGRRQPGTRRMDRLQVTAGGSTAPPRGARSRK